MKIIDYLKNLFNFNKKELEDNENQNTQDITARELMDSGSKLVVLFTHFSQEQIIKTFLQTNEEVLLVCGDSIDDVKGYYSLHMMLEQLFVKKTIDLSAAKPIKYLSPSAELMYILSLMYNRKELLLVITNEFGGTEGIISKNSITNNMYENYTSAIFPDSGSQNGVIVLNGNTPIWKLKQLLDIDLDDYDCETVGGFVLEYFQNIPNVGDKFNFKEYVFTVLEVRQNLITKISLTGKNNSFLLE